MTLVQVQVKLVYEADTKWHAYELPSQVRLFQAPTEAEARAEAARRGYVIKEQRRAA